MHALTAKSQTCKTNKSKKEQSKTIFVGNGETAQLVEWVPRKHNNMSPRTPTKYPGAVAQTYSLITRETETRKHQGLLVT